MYSVVTYLTLFSSIINNIMSATADTVGDEVSYLFIECSFYSIFKSPASDGSITFTIEEKIYCGNLLLCSLVSSPMCMVIINLYGEAIIVAIFKLRPLLFYE